jgi:leucyl aminopeptidase
MNFTYKTDKFDNLIKPATVVFIAADEVRTADKNFRPVASLVQPHLDSGLIKAGKEGVTPIYQGDSGWLLLVGLEKITRDSILEAAAKAAKKLQDLGVNKGNVVVPNLPLDKTAVIESLQLGFSLALTPRPTFKSEKENKPELLSEVALIDPDSSISQEAALAVMEKARIVAGAQLRARYLTDKPANLLYPEVFADEIAGLAAEFGLKAVVWDSEKLTLEGAGGVLSVGQGSSHPPRMVILEYQSPEADLTTGPTALVGKGVTFDSGGLCLKPPENMSQMKTDMAGAAAVVSTVLAAAELKLPVHLVGITPLVENLPGDTAFRPGDIIKTLSGKTVEIMNTDAEGRIILADALTLAHEYHPSRIIDLATLTGACIVALGEELAGLFCDNPALTEELTLAASRAAEEYWPLPLYQPYDEKLKSDLADFRGSATRSGGAILGALFLKRFIKPSLPWAHLDIVGTARNSSSKASCPEGATGFGVRTLLKLLDPGSEPK